MNAGAALPFHWIGPAEAAQIQGVNKTRLYEMVKRHDIPHLRGPVRFDQTTLVDWARRQLEDSHGGISSPGRLVQQLPRQGPPREGRNPARAAQLEGANNKREANKAEAAMRVQVEKEIADDTALRASSAASEAVKADPDRFGKFADHWLESHVRVHKKPGTFRLYGIIVRQWLKPYFGDVRLDEITAERIDGYLAWAKEHRVPQKVGAGEKARVIPGKPRA